MSIKLTNRVCETAPTSRILWDSDLRGFGLRVHQTGRRTFIVNYRTADGVQRRATLGGFPAASADDARRRARELLGEVLRGGDPVDERRRTRVAASFAELAEWYINEHARPRLKTARELERTVRRVLIPRWGSRKAESITRRDTAALHSELGKRGPYSANRTLALISAIFSTAERRGQLPEGHPNPARRVERFPEHDRDRWLSVEEVARMVQVLESEPSVFVRAYFWLALLTGMRKRELLTVRWDWIDFDTATLRLPDTKTGRPHRVPLSPRALEILQSLPREHDNCFLFPGRVTGSHLSVAAIDQAWRRIRQTAGAGDAHIHDLRRTVGSWLAQHGASLHLIGAVLNHSTPSTTAVYARIADANVRAALDAHAERVLSITPSIPPAEQQVDAS
jgi:integrase